VDNPYVIPGGSNQDNWPFAYKWGWDIVAMWHFDEGAGQWANDSSGNDNNGTLKTVYPTNSPNWTNGISGNALQFDGVDDYVDVGSSSDFYFSSTDNFTISMWINAKNFSGSEGMGAFLINRNGGSYTNRNYGIQLPQNGNVLFVS